MLGLIELVILGILQGVFEWIPISSQGQVMIVATSFLGLSAKEAFSMSMYLHIGTMFAALVYLRRDILALPQKPKVLTFLVIATFISFILGLPMYILLRKIVSIAQQELIALITGALLVVTGIVLFMSRQSGNRTEDDVGMTDGLFSGLLQSFSIFPGISRSGVTTFILLMSRFNQETALRLSFLMSIPVVLAGDIFLGIVEASFKAEYIVAIIVAFVVGLVGIDLLLRIARRIPFAPFCIIMGLLAMISPLLGLL